MRTREEFEGKGLYGGPFVYSGLGRSAKVSASERSPQLDRKGSDIGRMVSDLGRRVTDLERRVSDVDRKGSATLGGGSPTCLEGLRRRSEG